MPVRKVPISSKNPEEGTITYQIRDETLFNASPGLFSFTYYIYNPFTEESLVKSVPFYLYMKGICEYLKLTQMEGPFKNWSVVLYMDIFTYRQITKKSTDFLADYRSALSRGDAENDIATNYLKLLTTHPAVVFAVIDWPSHQRRERFPQINGPALRPFRSRAPFDFRDKIIFIRDADTLFESDLKHSLEDDIAGKDSSFTQKLLEWESSFWTTIPTIQKMKGGNPPLIVGTGGTSSMHFGFIKSAPSINSYYIREWHSNELRGINAPFGVFAGFVNVIPGIPVYQTMEAWDDFITFVNEHSKITEKKSSRLINDMKYNGKQSFSEENQNAYIQQKLDSVKNNPYVIPSNVAAYWQTKKENIYRIFSNDELVHRIGRDEQLYLFILMPRALDNLFIFKVDLGMFYMIPAERTPEQYKKFHNARMEQFIPFVSLLTSATDMNTSGGRRRRIARKKTRKVKGYDKRQYLK